MIDLSWVTNYYVACSYTVNGLAEIVIHQNGTELNKESLFLFCGRRTDRKSVVLLLHLHVSAYAFPTKNDGCRFLRSPLFAY